MASAFVVGSHHLAHAFAKRGHFVAHISTPVSLVHFLRWAHSETRARIDLWKRGAVWRSETLVEFVPMSTLPWKLARYLPFGRVRSWLALGNVTSRLKRSGFDTVDLLLVDQPKMVGIEDLVPARHLVYRATDVYKDMDGDEYILAAERRLGSEAELLVGTSGPVVEHLQHHNPGKRCLLLENGVDVELFSQPAEAPSEYSSIPTPRLIYAGALDQRFDFDLIEVLAKELASTSIVLIGPAGARSEMDRLRRLPNVYVLGARSYATIPGYYQHADVGLLPFSGHAANAGRSPMKLYEYGAARLPVVAVASRELARRALPFVLLSENQARFVGAVRELVGDLDRCKVMGEQGLEIARGMSWQAIADRLLCAVDQIGINILRTLAED